MNRRFVAAVLACTIAGCSFSALERLPDHPRPEQAPRCSRSSVVVPLDVLLTVAMTIATIGASVTVARHYEEVEPEDRVVGMAVPAALTALAATSAWWGQRQIDRCDDARVQHEHVVDQLRRAR